jgi:hypothetical protein
MVGNGGFNSGGVLQELAPSSNFSGATVAIATTEPFS